MSKKGLYIGGHSGEFGNPKTGYVSDDPFAYLKRKRLMGKKKAKTATEPRASSPAKKAKVRKPKLRAWRAPS